MDIDWKTIFNKYYSKKIKDEFGLNGCDSFEGTFEKYYIEQAKRISIRKRKIHLSKNFKCPEHNKDGLEKLKLAISDGEDLNKYLSKQIKNEAFKDNLYNHWNIRHFHLGSNVAIDGFIERSSELLYAVVDDNNVYMINVLPHNEWYNIDLMEIIIANWPFLVLEVKGITPVFREDEEIKLLRVNDVNFVVPYTDKSYLPSTGVAGDGIPFGLRQRCHYLLLEFENDFISINQELEKNKEIKFYSYEKFEIELLDLNDYGASKEYKFNIKVERTFIFNCQIKKSTR